MISAKELRIGNYTSEGKVVSFYENGIHVGFGKCRRFSELEPIELSEEILLKCGFDKEVVDYNGFSVINFKLNGWLPFLKEMKLQQCKWYKVYNVADCHISYLHQLQNLYFALTGKELKIEL